MSIFLLGVLKVNFSFSLTTRWKNEQNSNRISWALLLNFTEPIKNKQHGRLAPAYFSQEYKYFDQHLPTVKNETTV